MKLAELLNERKIVKENIKAVKERLLLSAKAQEGDSTPPEPPEELIQALINLHHRLQNLIVTVNRANMESKSDGKTLLELISERDYNAAVSRILHELAERATPRPERFSRNEIRYIPMVDIHEIRKEADSYALKAREIDNRLQAANWNTEVA